MCLSKTAINTFCRHPQQHLIRNNRLAPAVYCYSRVERRECWTTKPLLVQFNQPVCSLLKKLIAYLVLQALNRHLAVIINLIVNPYADFCVFRSLSEVLSVCLSCLQLNQLVVFRLIVKSAATPRVIFRTRGQVRQQIPRYTLCALSFSMNA